MKVHWEADPGWLSIEGWPCGSVALQAHVGAALGENPTELHPWSAEAAETEPDGALSFSGPGLRLELRTEVAEDGVWVRGTLVALRPLRLGWAAFSISSTLLQDLSKVSMFRQGYASWTPTYATPATARIRRPLSRSFAIANHPVDSRWYQQGRGILSSWFTVLAQEQEGLLIGFPGQRVGLGEIMLGNHTVPPYLIANLDYGGKTMAWGEGLALEPLLLAWGPKEDMPGHFADAVAREHEVDADALLVRPAPVGWCSWYQFYTRVKPEDVRRNTGSLTDLRAHGARLVQLDDGYQRAVGDWRILDPKFGEGLAPLAKHIAAAGFQAGIWLAPFTATRRSRLVAEHADWILRDGRGRMVDCGLNPAWRDGLVALDLSHPGVLRWLRSVFEGLTAEGFDFFKLDFLYTGLRQGVRHDPRSSPVESYREALAVIRDAVGPDRFLLGCGAPLGPSVGLVDGMRVSADVAERWNPGLLGWLGADCGAASVRESARNNLTRAFLHRRVWLNDPDCLLVRQGALGDNEVRFLVTVVAMTGGLGLVSDDLAALSPERRALLDVVLPPTPLRGKATGLLSQAFPDTFVLKGPERMLMALLAWGGKAKEWALWDEETWDFDFWRRKPLLEGEVLAPRRGVVADLMTPRRDVPQLIGTDLHLTAPVDGRLSDEFESLTGALTLSARDIPGRRGDLWVAIPAGYRLLPGRPPEVVGERRWEHGVIFTVDAAPPWRFHLRFARGGTA